jgi:hypothetical protein
MHVVIAAAAVAAGLTTFYTLAAALAATATVVGAIWLAVKIYHKLFRRVGQFLDDWNGEVARPGVEARPGVMARLSAIEYEVNYDHGGSMKDQVRTLGVEVTSLHDKLDKHIESTG